MNMLRVFIFISILIISSFVFINPVPATEVENRDYTVRPDGSILYDSGQIAYGISTFTATDDIKYLKSDYPGASLVDQGQYWSTPEPSPLSGRFYDDGRIYLGKDTDHYVGMKPVGIFYINHKDPTEREQLISLTSMSLSVNDNVATYSQGPVSIVFTNSFSRIKGDVIFPNAPLIPTVSNPSLAVVWEVVGHAGISMEDGERDKWWFEQAMASFPVGDIQNNGSAVLKKKIFRQNDKIYLVEGVGYSWVSDVNRTDSHFILDPTVEYNGSDNWAGTSGTMLEHGDGNLRAPPNVTTGLVSYWNPGTDVGSGNTLTDIWGVNDGTIHGATWNMTSGVLEYDGDNDYVDCGNDSNFVFGTGNFTLITTAKLIAMPVDTYPVLIGKGDTGAGEWMFRHDVATTVELFGDVSNIARTSAYTYLDTELDLAFVRNGDTAHTYVEGIQKGFSSGISAKNFSTTKNIRLGNGDGAANRYYNGSIGLTYLYSVSLTNPQINETRDNYHTTTAHRQIDTANDYGTGQVLKYINVTGTDPSANTTMAVYVNGSHNGVDFNGWELVNGSCNVGDNVTVPNANQYRYAAVKIVSNTTYQPETNIITSFVLTSGDAGEYLYYEVYNTVDTIGSVAYSDIPVNATVLKSASTTGTANISMNTAGAGETYNFTVNSGTVDWLNVTSGLISGSNYSIYNGTTIESQLSDGSVNFTTDLSVGTYSILLDLLSPQNLTNITELTQICFNWDDYASADKWNISQRIPSISYTDVVIVLDGVKDAEFTNRAHTWILNSPNPTGTNGDKESISWIRNSTTLSGYADGEDDDALINDDSFKIMLDMTANNLTTDDRQFILSESGTVTAKRWSGAAWLPQATNAVGVVIGAGVAGDIQYEMQIPISELTNFNNGSTIKLAMAREDTSQNPDVIKYFPKTLINDTDATIWTSIILSAECEYTFLGNTTLSNYTVTGLTPFTWYRHRFSTINGSTESSYVYSNDVTKDSPQYIVSGYILTESGLPIPNADVWSVCDCGCICEVNRSNATGYYQGDCFYNGTYSIYASKTDYDTNSTSIVVNGANQSNVNITLPLTPVADNTIPLSIFIMWSVIMFTGAIIGFMTTGLYGITSSLLTATIAYMNSKNIINGNVVQYFSGVSTSDTIVVGYRSIESLPMSYIYLFIAIVMVIVFILQVKNEIQYNLEPDMDGDFFDE